MCFRISIHAVYSERLSKCQSKYETMRESVKQANMLPLQQLLCICGITALDYRMSYPAQCPFHWLLSCLSYLSYRPPFKLPEDSRRSVWRWFPARQEGDWPEEDVHQQRPSSKLSRQCCSIWEFCIFAHIEERNLWSSTCSILKCLSGLYSCSVT